MNESVVVDLKIDEDALSDDFVRATESKTIFTTGTIIAIAVCAFVAAALPVVCWIARSKKKRAHQKQGSRYVRKRSINQRTPTTDDDIENWNFDSADGVGSVEPEQDDGGLTWDGEGLRLWDRDNSVKVGPRPISISSSLKSTSQAGSIKLMPSAPSWVPRPPKASATGFGLGRSSLRNAGNAGYNKQASTRSVLSKAYLGTGTAGMFQQGGNVASDATYSIAGSVLTATADDEPQRIDTLIANRYGSVGYGADGMVGAEEDMGYQNHSELGMLQNVVDFPVIGVLGFGTSSETDTIASEQV